MSRAMTNREAESAALRCAVYTRKSTEEGLEQEFNTLDAQREAGEAYIASQKSEGWVCLSELYDDGGFSGGNMERPALKRLMTDIEAGKVDCVVVYKVDRLSRSLLDFARIMEVFDKRKIAFVSVTQQFNTATPMGRLVLNVLLSFAQFEREIIGERIRDKIAAQRRKGKWAGGFPILGYDIDRTGNSPKLEVNAEEAAQVREIFGLYLSLGSLLPVVDELETRGWRNKRWRTKKGPEKGGQPFDKGNLHGLLTNPLYIGKIRHKSDIYDGEHEAIVSAEIYKKVQLRLQSNCRSGGVEARNRYGALLRGLLFCKACGRAMVHNFAGKGARRYRYYTCCQAIKSGRSHCPTRSLPAAEIENFVVDQIRSIAKDRDLRREVFRQAEEDRKREIEEVRTEQRELQRELARHHREIRKLATGGSAASATTAGIAELHGRIARAETRAAELRARLEFHEGDQLKERQIAETMGDFDNIWNALSLREQAELIALLVARVEFDAEDSTLAVTFHPTLIKSLNHKPTGEAA